MCNSSSFLEFTLHFLVNKATFWGDSYPETAPNDVNNSVFLAFTKKKKALHETSCFLQVEILRLAALCEVGHIYKLLIQSQIKEEDTQLTDLQSHDPLVVFILLQAFWMTDNPHNVMGTVTHFYSQIFQLKLAW